MKVLSEGESLVWTSTSQDQLAKMSVLKMIYIRREVGDIILSAFSVTLPCFSLCGVPSLCGEGSLNLFSDVGDPKQSLICDPTQTPRRL
jgi:hypothetical protein